MVPGVVVTGALSYDIVIPELVANPVPLMVTTVPVDSVAGVSDTAGVTVNFLVAICVPSVAPTVCGAVTDSGTVNVAVKLPVASDEVLATDTPL